MSPSSDDPHGSAWYAGGPPPPRRARREPDTDRVPLPAPAAEATRAPQPVAGPWGGYGRPNDDLDDAYRDRVDIELFERQWDRPQRTNRLTAVLVAGLVAVAGFAGGVLTQKHHDAGLTSAAAAATSALRSRASAGGFGPGSGGFAGGGFGGAGGTQAGSAVGGGSGPVTGSGQGAAGSASQVPVVVGTLSSISGRTLTVKNFADALITVVVTPATTVTVTGLGGLTVGAPVSVAGTKAAGGTVTATAITSHSTGG